MMDEIYKMADRVNVHLGEGDRASDVACQTLKGLAAAYLLARMPSPMQATGRKKYEKLAEDALRKYISNFNSHWMLRI